MNECESIFNPGTYIKGQMAMFHVSLFKPPIAGATEKLLYHGTEVPAVCLFSRNTCSCLDRQGKPWKRTYRPKLVCRNLLDDNSQEATKLAHQRRIGKFLDVFETTACNSDLFLGCQLGLNDSGSVRSKISRDAMSTDNIVGVGFTRSL